MTEEMVLNLGGQALQTIAYIAGPILFAALAVGLVVSVLQAITQINEATLTFIPKMLAIIAVLVVLAPWMMQVMEDYTVVVISQAGEWVH